MSSVGEGAFGIHHRPTRSAFAGLNSASHAARGCGKSPSPPIIEQSRAGGPRGVETLRVLDSIRAIAFALAGLMVLFVPAAAPDAPRFVPQLALTDLKARKVAVAPDEPTLLTVINGHHRIDLFDISIPSRPVKITEILAAANDAAFAPKGTARDKSGMITGSRDGTRIVSAGR